MSAQKDVHTVCHVGLAIHTSIAFCAAIDANCVLKARDMAV